MLGLPPLPTWDGLHPLVVHFPVALLLVAPLLVVVGALVRQERGRVWLTAALVLLTLGTVATWMAVASGEAAGRLAERAPGVEAALEHHEELAETTRAVFTGLSLALAAILFGPLLFRRPLARRPQLTLLGLFLVTYVAGALLLANTAHAGGTLVHRYGVTAMIGADTAAAAAPTTPAVEAGEEDDD